MINAFQNKKAFITYLMAGDPNLEVSAEYILAAQAAGADLIEIGIPFSDPIAEGEAVQAANIRALNAGTKLNGIFDMVASIKNQIQVPMVFMTYLNPVYVYGYNRFFKCCADMGISGIIIPDIPFEEQEEVKEAAEKHGIEIIMLIAPTSGKRIELIAKNAGGFIYLVSSASAIGVSSEISTALPDMVAGIKKITETPIVVDFDNSSPEQEEYSLAIADGVIAGSSVMSIVGQYGADAKPALYEHIRSMKEKIKYLSCFKNS